MIRMFTPLVVIGLVLSACGSRQGVPSTATHTQHTFKLSNKERPTRIAVKSGDTIYGLAYKYGISSRSLIAANGIQPPYTLEPGQELDLPAPQEHVIIEGEDLEGIAAFYGVDAVVLARENRIGGTSSIKPGDRLVIPTRDTVAADASASPIHSTVVATSSLAPLDMGNGHTKETSLISKGNELNLSSEIAAEKLGPIDIDSELKNELATEVRSELPPETPAESPESNVTPVTHTSVPSNEHQAQEKDDNHIIPVPPVKTIAGGAVAAGAVVTAASKAASTTSAAVPTPLAKPAALVAIPQGAPTPAPVSEPAPIQVAAYIWPTHGKVLSQFGDALPDGSTNDGVNIAVSAGTPIQASAGGEVVYAGDGLKNFGNLVLVKHKDGYMTAYGHNSKLLVKKGQIVQQGQKIAEAGSTGDVKSPQLHFELRRGTEPVDPKTQLGS